MCIAPWKPAMEGGGQNLPGRRNYTQIEGSEGFHIWFEWAEGLPANPLLWPTLFQWSADMKRVNGHGTRASE